MSLSFPPASIACSSTSIPAATTPRDTSTTWIDTPGIAHAPLSHLPREPCKALGEPHPDPGEHHDQAREPPRPHNVAGLALLPQTGPPHFPRLHAASAAGCLRIPWFTL